MSGKQAFAVITTANMKKWINLSQSRRKDRLNQKRLLPENKIHLIKETILQIAFEFRESDENLQIEKKKNFLPGMVRLLLRHFKSAIWRKLERNCFFRAVSWLIREPPYLRKMGEFNSSDLTSRLQIIPANKRSKIHQRSSTISVILLLHSRNNNAGSGYLMGRDLWHNRF
ncbi:hypothetical protein CEXT_389741 [Caerostris extrusa]|uniref:Ribosomal protein S7 n=1 Tax=Caerostris extrusa TaxID=172846 RepID=A0AAV4V902_CAEEX|nr:hypothetical protein CEXT_389741 [Caerostris extrusa]